MVYYSIGTRGLLGHLGRVYAGIQFNNHADAPYTGIGYNRGPFDIMLHGTDLTVHYNGADSASLATLALGQTHLVVGRWGIGAGNDSLSVWADPADLQSIGAPLLTKNDADAGAALYLAGVFAYGSSTSGTSRQGKLDALRISDGVGDVTTGYQDVTGVTPEPATVALVLAGLAFSRRRRQWSITKRFPALFRIPQHPCQSPFASHERAVIITDV